MVMALVYEFDDFELDESLFELRWMGRPVRVQPKVWALIRHLVQHHTRVIPIAELVHELWPDQVVGETSLTKAVRGARRVLGDSGTCQATIRTVRGRGYRFAKPVRPRATVNGHLPTKSQTPTTEHSPDPLRCRLEALSGGCRSALMLAVAIGYEFSIELLSAAANMPHDDVIKLLDEARLGGFIHSWPSSRTRYVFSPGARDVLCDAAAGDLAAMQRRVRLAVEANWAAWEDLGVS
jgi:DNA-binding winged helix-turn-helix (wHTH) protein